MLGKPLTRSELHCRGVQVGSTMERVKQVQTKLGSHDARQTLGSIRVKQGSDLVGDSREVSIISLGWNWTPQTRAKAFVAGLGPLAQFAPGGHFIQAMDFSASNGFLIHGLLGWYGCSERAQARLLLGGRFCLKTMEFQQCCF